MSHLESNPLTWKTRSLLITHFLATLLLLSWFVEPAKSIWLYLDIELFWFFNNLLKDGSDGFRYLWALLNMKNFDRIIAIILLSLFFIHALRNERRLWGRHAGIMVAMFVVLGVWTGYGTVTGIGQLLPIERLSATLEFPESFRLTHWATDLKTKDSSPDSFPGDHGMILIIVASFVAYYFSKPYIWFTVIFAFLGTLPRVVAGAHWLTDEVVGALFIAMLAYSWNFHTPVGEFIVQKVDWITMRAMRRLGIIKDAG